MQSEFLKTLEGRVPEKYDPALVHALYDIHCRLQRISTKAWMRRFNNCVIEHFESCIWEAQNRADGKIPDTATYILMRPYTGGLYTVIELIDVSDNIHLPFYVRKNEILQRLALMASNVVCWSNDIISFAKENRYHDVHNLVSTLLPSQPSLQKSIDLATKMTNDEISAFIELERQLPSFSPKIDKDVQRYVEILRSWMRGNLDWSYESGRYVVETNDFELE